MSRSNMTTFIRITESHKIEYLYSPENPVATKKEKNKHTNLIK